MIIPLLSLVERPSQWKSSWDMYADFKSSMVEIIVNQQLVVHGGDDHGGAAIAMAEELVDHNHLRHRRLKVSVLI
jgi:hypothetical protein